MCIDHDLARTIYLNHIAENTTIGYQTDLYKDAIQADHPFFFCFAVFDTDAGHLISIAYYFGCLRMNKNFYIRQAFQFFL